MKQKITILTSAFLLMAITASATVWRVNNRPNVDADFTTLQDAIDGASGGDTLYIGASETTYGSGIFDKQLIAIGAGYWLAENDTTQAYTEESQTGRLTFNDGSQGSEVMGLYIYESLDNDPRSIIILTDNISITRNFILTYEQDIQSYHSPVCIYISGNNDNINITQNWIYSTRVTVNNTYAIGIWGILTNSIISNNFIRSQYTKYAVYMSTSSTATELIISNNVMWGITQTYYTIHNNNIQIEGTYNNGTGDLTSNNLCNATQYPALNSNQQNIDMSTVFIDYVGYIDNDYILTSGSPAIGAGINGGDCGAFGNGSGGDPYVLSGIPAIPSVFEATVTTMGSSVLPVNIKASSHN